MVWRKATSAVFLCRVHGSRKRSRICSTGMRDERAAKDVEAFAERMKSRRRWDVLDPIIEKQLNLADAYDADCAGTLDALLRRVNDRDLNSLVAEWNGGSGDPVTTARYLQRVREFIPTRRFPISDFTRANISKFLSGLAVGVKTKRYYRTAISMFARWLIEREIIETNPARDVTLGKAPRRPILFLEENQARTLIDSLTGEQRALEALMFATGMERQACEALTVRDIDFDNRLVFAKGRKTEYRTRWVEVTEDFAWEHFKRYVTPMRADPTRPVFPTPMWRALITHRTAVTAAKLPPVTLHHWRHAHAVMWIRRGACGGLRTDRRDEQWLKNQLGHEPSSNKLRTTYGVYINAAKLTEQQKERRIATASATRAQRKVK